MGIAVAGCTSVPVRPTQQECPRAALKAMEKRGWEKFSVWLKPNHTKPGEGVTLQPGPLISVAKPSNISDLNNKELLHGHVYFAEDGRIVIRYTEVELEGGARVPICFAVIAGDNETIDPQEVGSRTEESVYLRNSQTANRMRVLPD